MKFVVAFKKCFKVISDKIKLNLKWGPCMRIKLSLLNLFHFIQKIMTLHLNNLFRLFLFMLQVCHFCNEVSGVTERFLSNQRFFLAASECFILIGRSRKMNV